MTIVGPRLVAPGWHFLIVSYAAMNIAGTGMLSGQKRTAGAKPLLPIQVTVHGILGDGITASYENRLKHFIRSLKSEPVAIFDSASSATNHAGDWYGEHVGKWLVAAARAAARTRDDSLRKTILTVCDYLMDKQESNGYLGTYAADADARFTSPRAYGTRTWDVWVHSYMILGLLEVNAFWPDPRYVAASKKIADLFIDVFGTNTRSLAMMGSHDGLSCTIALDPMVKLYETTHEKKYLDFAWTIVRQMEERKELQLISRCLAGADMSEIGTGKIYQICWNLVGVLRLYEVTGIDSLKIAVERAWKNIVDYHLTPMGGPWGGVSGHKEVFNGKDFFSPYGLTENCSIMSWMQLNKKLGEITGESKYAAQFEQTMYNALLGAQDPNGEDWCYFTFPNGKRNNTYYWACCKSSGAMALEEIPNTILGIKEGGIMINLYVPSEISLTLPSIGPVAIRQKTTYPQSDSIEITVDPEKQGRFPLFVRIPSWTSNPTISIDGKHAIGVGLTDLYRVDRVWKKGDRVIVRLPMKLTVLPRSYSVNHHGQEVVRQDFFCVARGPLVFSTGLIDGFKRAETFKLPLLNPETQFSRSTIPKGATGPAFQMNIPGRDPIIFLPYYESGGRSDGKWRLTWMDVAWQ